MRRKGLLEGMSAACMVLGCACDNGGGAAKEQGSRTEQEKPEQDGTESESPEAAKGDSKDVSFPLKESVKLSVFMPQNSDVVD